MLERHINEKYFYSFEIKVDMITWQTLHFKQEAIKSNYLSLTVHDIQLLQTGVIRLGCKPKMSVYLNKTIYGQHRKKTGTNMEEQDVVSAKNTF